MHLYRLLEKTPGTMSEAGMLRKTYNWVLQWAETPYGIPALFLLAFTESSFFPIPPDVLLIALAMGMPQKAFRYAWICTAGSVLGGMFGFFIGLKFFSLVGIKILELYGVMDKFALVQSYYLTYDVWFVGIAGFTPIPYKVFTIAAGVFRMNFFKFVIVSAATRGARFFIVSALFWKFGQRIRVFIDRYFNLLTILFVIILVAGFAVVKLLF